MLIEYEAEHIAREAENIAARVGLHVERSRYCICPPKYGGIERLVVDTLGFEHNGVIYLCIDRIVYFARIYRIDVNVFARYVLLHELCHAHLDVEDKTYSLKQLDPEEAYCEFVALKSLYTGMFSLCGQDYQIERVKKQIVNRISGLPRAKPYSMYKKYVMAELIGIEPFELFQQDLKRVYNRSLKCKKPTRIVLCYDMETRY